MDFGEDFIFIPYNSSFIMVFRIFMLCIYARKPSYINTGGLKSRVGLGNLWRSRLSEILDTSILETNSL